MNYFTYAELQSLVTRQSEVIESMQIDSRYKDDQIKKLTERIHAERMLRQDLQRGVEVGSY